jgi:hypothetical protein
MCAQSIWTRRYDLPRCVSLSVSVSVCGYKLRVCVFWCVRVCACVRCS